MTVSEVIDKLRRIGITEFVNETEALDGDEPLEFDINMEKLMANPRFVEIVILIGEDYPRLKEFFLLSTVINDTKIDYTLIWENDCIEFPALLSVNKNFVTVVEDLFIKIITNLP